MAELSPNIAIIALNVNGLNPSNKKELNRVDKKS